MHDWAILTVLKARLKSDVPIIKGARFWWIGRKNIEKKKRIFFCLGGGGIIKDVVVEQLIAPYDWFQQER